MIFFLIGQQVDALSSWKHLVKARSRGVVRHALILMDSHSSRPKHVTCISELQLTSWRDLCCSAIQYSDSGSMCSQSQAADCFTWVLLRLQLTTKTMTHSNLIWVSRGGKMTNKEIHSERRSFPTSEPKLHWSKPFLVLHPLKSSQIKKQDKPKYSLQRKIENSSFLWHENISGVYIWSETVSIHIGQNSPCSKARKSQIKCEATSGLNIAQKTERNKKTKTKQSCTLPSPKTWHDRQQHKTISDVTARSNSSI